MNAWSADVPVRMKLVVARAGDEVIVRIAWQSHCNFCFDTPEGRVASQLCPEFVHREGVPACSVPFWVRGSDQCRHDKLLFLSKEAWENVERRLQHLHQERKLLTTFECV